MQNWNPRFHKTAATAAFTLMSLAAAALAVACSVFAFLCGFQGAARGGGGGSHFLSLSSRLKDVDQ